MRGCQPHAMDLLAEVECNDINVVWIAGSALDIAPGAPVLPPMRATRHGLGQSLPVHHRSG
jgi:hypothetical protein